MFVHEHRTFRNLFVLHRMHLTAEWGEDKAQHPALWTWHRIKVNLTISFHVKSNSTESSANICQLCRLWCGECTLDAQWRAEVVENHSSYKEKRKKKACRLIFRTSSPIQSETKEHAYLHSTNVLMQSNLVDSVRGSKVIADSSLALLRPF